MTPERRNAFSLVELLVVIGTVGVTAGLLLPVLGKTRMAAKNATTTVMLNTLQMALAEYHRDFGVYPSRGGSPLSKCSESLYYHLAGSDFDSPNANFGRSIRNKLRNCRCYFEFKKEHLGDFDRDNYYEALDSWGQPWLYIPVTPPWERGGAFGMGKPWHNKTTYDLYSVGPDGRTGPEGSWNASSNGFAIGPAQGSSFYKQAADQIEDGDRSSGALHSHDDIANF